VEETYKLRGVTPVIGKLASLYRWKRPIN